MAAIFQLPCKSRSKPSAVYSPEYYDPIFNEKTQKQIAAICKELLYIDYYFTKKFVPKFDNENKNMPSASDKMPFAHIARTICIAFVALAARYAHGNLNDNDITLLVSNPVDKGVYEKLRDIGNIKYLLPLKLYADSYDATLDKLFKAIIENGFLIYSIAHDYNKGLTAANYLKKDDNYYTILNKCWSTLSDKIREIFKVSN